MANAVMPGDNFHGFLALGNDSELLAAIERLKLQSPAPCACTSELQARDLAIVQDRVRKALASEGGMAAFPELAEKAQRIAGHHQEPATRCIRYANSHELSELEPE